MLQANARMHFSTIGMAATCPLRSQSAGMCINYVVLQGIDYPAETLCPHCVGEKGIVLDGTDLCIKSLAMSLPNPWRLKGDICQGPRSSGMLFLPTCGTFEAVRLVDAYTSLGHFNIKKCRTVSGESLTDSQLERLRQLLGSGDRGGKVFEGKKGQWTTVASDQQPSMRDTFAPRLKALLPLLADSIGEQDKRTAPVKLRPVSCLGIQSPPSLRMTRTRQSIECSSWMPLSSYRSVGIGSENSIYYPQNSSVIFSFHRSRHTPAVLSVTYKYAHLLS